MATHTFRTLFSVAAGGLICTALPVLAAPPAEVFSNLPLPVAASSYGTHATAGEINTAELVKDQQNLKLVLPDGKTILIDRNQFKLRGKKSALWLGRVTGEPDSQVVLSLKKNRLFGRISIGEDVYEVRPERGVKKFGHHGHVIEKLDLAAFPGCDAEDHQHELPHPAAADSPGLTSPQSLNTAASDGGIITIDLLSTYTPNARIKAGGVNEIEAMIQAAVDVSNTAFIESNMNVRYNLVHTAEVNYTATGDTGDALRWVDDDPEVAALREQFGADMVSLIVDTASSCGTAWVQRNPGSSFAAYAFQATDIDCAVGNMTFAHEHGHNMGMEHNPENSSATPDTASYPWSFAHYVNGSYRTVMSYSSPCSNGCSRVARFSSPSVIYAGQPAGIVDERENALTGDATAPIVAAFRASVTGPSNEINVQVAQSLDDVEESKADGSILTDSSDLEFGYDSWSGVQSEQYTGLRFLNVAVPQGATINRAYLEFTTDEIGSETTSAEIRVQASDNAPPFTTTSYNVSSRTTTNTVVHWAPSSWDTIGQTHQSPDLSSLIQGVTDRAGWSSGNSLAFVIDTTGHRVAEAFDGVASSAPRLHLEYQLAETPVNQPPEASFTVTPNTGQAPLVSLFDATDSTDEDGSIQSYSWDFGDGGSDTGQKPSYTYTYAGSYTATLTVIDDDGATDSFSQNITVSQAGPVTVFYDSFENGQWNGLWSEDSQNDWLRGKQRSTSGTYTARVDGSANDAKLISIPIDLQGHTRAIVEFNWYIENGLDKGEYLAFDVSTDGGNNWTEKARLSGNQDPENTWHQAEITLDGISSLQLRFRGKMSKSNEDADVDEVRVTVE